MKKTNRARWLLPGCFLLVLGVGNVAVGLFKVDQYQEVVDDLAERDLEMPPALAAASALERIQKSERGTDRLLQRQQKARARVDFYRLVILGGKVFLALSIPFFIVALLLRMRALATDGGRNGVTANDGGEPASTIVPKGL